MRAINLLLLGLWIETKKILLGQLSLGGLYLFLLLIINWLPFFLLDSVNVFVTITMPLLFWTRYHAKINREFNFPSFFQVPINNLQRFIICYLLPIVLLLCFLVVHSVFLALEGFINFLSGSENYNWKGNRLHNFSVTSSTFLAFLIYHSLFAILGVFRFFCHSFYVWGIIGGLILIGIFRKTVGVGIDVLDPEMVWVIIYLLAWILYFIGLKRVKIC